MGVTERTEFASKDDASRPWLVECEKDNCHFRCSAKTQEFGEQQLASHKCPMSKPARFGGKSLIEKMWDELDDTVGLIQDEGPSSDVKAGLKKYAEGIAFCIAVMAEPYFTSVKGVSVEALRRWKMRTGQMEFAPTPGYEWYPSLVVENAREPYSPAYQRAVEAAAGARARAEASSGVSTRTRATARGRVWTDKEKSAIQAGLRGGFTEKELATMYSCTVAEIKSAV